MQGTIFQPTKKELRNFGFVTAGLTPVFFGLLIPWLFAGHFPRWPWIAAGVLTTWAAVLPASLKPLYVVWMSIGQVLGWINTRIILSILFYLVILPVGLVMRLAGHDPMARSVNREQRSYRVASTVPPKNHVERPY